MRIIDVEQGTYEWHVARKGKVTGTSLASALGTPAVQKTLMYKLIAERMTEPQTGGFLSKSVERGKEMEPLARKYISNHLGMDFVEVGMLQDIQLGMYAISPDAVVIENGLVVGGLEIKCPDSKKHVEYLIKNEVPKEYEYQVFAPFLMLGAVKFWYFASYDDRNYEQPLFLKKVTLSDVHEKYEVAESRNKLKEFLDSVHEAHVNLSF